MYCFIHNRDKYIVYIAAMKEIVLLGDSSNAYMLGLMQMKL